MVSLRVGWFGMGFRVGWFRVSFGIGWFGMSLGIGWFRVGFRVGWFGVSLGVGGFRVCFRVSWFMIGWLGLRIGWFVVLRILSLSFVFNVGMVSILIGRICDDLSTTIGKGDAVRTCYNFAVAGLLAVMTVVSWVILD